MSLADVHLHLIDSVDDAAELMRWLSTKDRIAVDTETSGLNPERDVVRTVQVGDAHHGWTIPWDRWGGVFEEIVRKYDGSWVGHNSKYDAAMLALSCGITLPRSRLDDTRIASHVLHPDRSTALKPLASYYVDPLAANLSRQLDETLRKPGGWTWATVPIDYEPYWQYAALDTVLTFKLDEIVMPKAKSEAPNAYDLESGVAWVAYGMERLGTRIDRDYAAEHLVKFQRYVEQAEQWCVDTYGVRPGQNASVIEILQRDGFTFDKTTATGAVSLDKEVLGGIDHPLAKVVLARRKVQKVASTYLVNFLEMSDGDDLLHPRINTLGLKQDENYRGGMGVRTGRMSMDTPNLQNLSRQTDGPSPGNVVRNCIVPRPEHTLLMIDFDQIEARVFAHMTGDQGLIDAFQEGDFFVNIARDIYRDPTFSKKDPRRQPTKNMLYGRLYGAGNEKMALTAGISVEAASAFNIRFDMLYPGARAFSNLVQRTAQERFNATGDAYVRSPITNRRYTAREDKTYALVNYLVQGTAAEVLKMKMLEMAAAGLDRHMILPVHDEIILDVPDDELGDVMVTARDIMNDDTMFRVPLTASPSVGKRWGEKMDVVM